jgi:hypothetical protein
MCSGSQGVAESFMNYQKPKLPERAKTSQAVLLRPLQDIDIYVEDVRSKEFYNVLFGRVLNGVVRFFSVIPLGGRESVEKRSETDNGLRLSIYFVDGDLDWVAGAHASCVRRLYVHQCYCIENYLLCAQAMKVVIHENSGSMSEDDVHIALNWIEFRSRLEHLVPLFIEFAVAHALNTGIPTVSRGYSAVITHVKGSLPSVDEGKVHALIGEIRNSILATCSEPVYERTKRSIIDRVETLHDKLLIVSGKDFILPLLYFEVRRIVAQDMTTESLMLRLAKHCDQTQLAGIRLFCESLMSEMLSA